MFLISFSRVSSYQFLCVSQACRATGYDTQENIIFIFTFVVAFAIYLFLLTLHSIRTNGTTRFMIYIFLYVYRNICYVYIHKMILSRISGNALKLHDLSITCFVVQRLNVI